jgi:hypothetical protein
VLWVTRLGLGVTGVTYDELFAGLGRVPAEWREKYCHAKASWSLIVEGFGHKLT